MVVFANGARVGFVIECRPSRYAAFSSDRRFYGEFASLSEATYALIINRTAPTHAEVEAVSRKEP